MVCCYDLRAYLSPRTLCMEIWKKSKNCSTNIECFGFKSCIPTNFTHIFFLPFYLSICLKCHTIAMCSRPYCISLKYNREIVYSNCPFMCTVRFFCVFDGLAKNCMPLNWLYKMPSLFRQSAKHFIDICCIISNL